MQKGRFFLIIGIIYLHYIAYGQATEEQSLAYLTENIQNLDPIEGIWKSEYYANGELAVSEKIFIVKSSDYFSIYLLDAFIAGDWLKRGSKIKDHIEKKSGKYYYYQSGTDMAPSDMFEIDFSHIHIIEWTETAYAFDKKRLTFNKNKIVKSDPRIWHKVYPLVEPRKNQNNESDIVPAGTCFLISTDGFVITNYHVIENAKEIYIRGVNNDFTKRLKAATIATDKNNDIALLKLDDSFVSTSEITYKIKVRQAEVGENVFTLGFPLTATMGDEIKLSNGVISSRSGFMNDVTTYQVSVPVQPGNSGGPLFDKDGNIIGIVSAKHSAAENVTYAVKSSYLINLVEATAKPPELDTNVNISDKALSEQVKLIKPFVYLIEILPLR